MISASQVYVPVVADQRERLFTELNRVYLVENNLGFETLGVLLEAFHELRALHAHRIGRPVVDVGRRHELAALSQARDQYRLQVGARGIDRRRVTGGSRAKNQESAMLGSFCHEEA